jgi:hypothetical protein
MQCCKHLQRSHGLVVENSTLSPHCLLVLKTTPKAWCAQHSIRVCQRTDPLEKALLEGQLYTLLNIKGSAVMMSSGLMTTVTMKTPPPNHHPHTHATTIPSTCAHLASGVVYSCGLVQHYQCTSPGRSWCRQGHWCKGALRDLLEVMCCKAQQPGILLCPGLPHCGKNMCTLFCKPLWHEAPFAVAPRRYC